MRPVIVYKSENCEVLLSSSGTQGVIIQARYFITSPTTRNVAIVLQNEVAAYTDKGHGNPDFKKDIIKYIKSSINSLKKYKDGDLIVKRLLGEFRHSYISLQDNFKEDDCGQ